MLVTCYLLLVTCSGVEQRAESRYLQSLVLIRRNREIYNIYYNLLLYCDFHHQNPRNCAGSSFFLFYFYIFSILGLNFITNSKK